MDRADELIKKAREITEEEKIEFEKEFEFLLDAFYKVHKEAIDKKDIVIKELMQQVKSGTIDVYNKEMIMQLFGCESQKALNILKLAMQMGYASKLGKEFIILKEDLQEFLKQIKGRDYKI